MRKWILLFAVLCMLNAFKVVVEENEKLMNVKARIPAYIGTGYHALKGNPYTNRVDQGFRSPIFQLTYNKGETTEDGQFQIPDFTHSTQTISCNMNSKVKSFSGTQNYQRQLSNMASFDTKFDAVVMSASFSFSFAFQSFVNKTVSKNMSSVQSNAECTVYTIQMPIYTNQMQLAEDFINGVKQSYASNNWEDFLEHFGAHYTTSVTFGGRYFLEHTYSEKSMSLFKSMNIDLSMAAQAQFFMSASISMSEELKRYANQTKVVNSKVESTSIATVGGLPPSSGNWVDWVNTVKGNLAPISYKFSAITVLFNFIPNFDSAGAIKSFSNFFNAYCTRNKCPPMTPDRPDPKPLSVVLSKGTEISGTAKSSNRYDTNDGKITAGMKIIKVLMGFGGSLQSFQFILSDGLTQHSLPRIGTAKTTKQYSVPSDDEIKCIRFGTHPAQNATAHMRFATVQYTTKGGSESDVYKGSGQGSDIKILCLPDQESHVVGMFGSWNNENETPDSIGLNFMKEILPS